MKKGSKMTEEQRKRVSEAQKKRFANSAEKKRVSEFFRGRTPWNKGKQMSEDYKKRSSEAHKGQVAWNKDRKVGKVLVCSICNKEFYASPSKIKRGAKYCSHSCMFKDPELIKKLSESHKGQIPTNLEQLRKINLGRKLSEESRRKISEKNKGKKRSIESIEKNRLAHFGKPTWNKGKKMLKIPFGKRLIWEKHPLFGKRHSEESLRKMRESHKKQMANPEFIKRLSEIHKKRLSNPEEMKRQVEGSRRTLLRLYESGTFPKQENTSIERFIKAELIKRGYKEGTDFIHQYRFMNKFMCDFCFPKQKVVVEAYGDFWHGNPIKYAGKKLHKHQIKGINRDKSKEAYIKTVDNHSWTFLSFWESDIKKDVTKCVDRIEETLAKKR